MPKQNHANMTGLMEEMSFLYRGLCFVGVMWIVRGPEDTYLIIEKKCSIFEYRVIRNVS